MEGRCRANVEQCIESIAPLIKACQKALHPAAEWESGTEEAPLTTSTPAPQTTVDTEVDREPASNTCQHPCSIIRDAIDELAEDINDQIVEFNESVKRIPITNNAGRSIKQRRGRFV